MRCTEHGMIGGKYGSIDNMKSNMKSECITAAGVLFTG